MPAINLSLGPKLAVTGRDSSGAANTFDGQSGGDEDFDSVMQATLAPAAPKVPPRQPPPIDRHLAAHTIAPQNSPTDAAGTSVETNKSTPKSEDAKEKKDSAKVDTTTKNSSSAATTTPLEQSTTPVFPLPVLLPLTFSYLGGLSGKADAAASGVKTSPTEAIVFVSGKKGVDTTAKSAAPTTPQSADARSALDFLTKAGKSADTAKVETPVKLSNDDASTVTDATSSPKTDLNGQDSGQNDAEKAKDLGKTLSQVKAGEDAGTGVANIVSPMTNQPKTNKVAGTEVKVLPGGDRGAALDNALPSIAVASARGAENSGADLNFSFSGGNSQPAVSENSSVLNVVDMPSLMDARLRTLERTHDMMVVHSMRLLESKLDTLSVVLKPSVGTELSLEVHLRPEGIEAHATLTRGDHEFLNQHWSELQQRLEQRGVKLAALGSEAGFPTGDNGTFKQQHASEEEAAQQASAFAEFASVSSVGGHGGATARATMVHDGWESWA